MVNNVNNTYRNHKDHLVAGLDLGLLDGLVVLKHLARIDELQLCSLDLLKLCQLVLRIEHLSAVSSNAWSLASNPLKKTHRLLLFELQWDLFLLEILEDHLHRVSLVCCTCFGAVVGCELSVGLVLVLILVFSQWRARALTFVITAAKNSRKFT